VIHGCVVNFVMHCLNADINVCDVLLFVSEAVSFLILKKKNYVTSIDYDHPTEVTGL
jgi:hypothetical protein